VSHRGLSSTLLIAFSFSREQLERASVLSVGVCKALGIVILRNTQKRLSHALAKENFLELVPSRILALTPAGHSGNLSCRWPTQRRRNRLAETIFSFLLALAPLDSTGIAGNPPAASDPTPIQKAEPARCSTCQNSATTQNKGATGASATQVLSSGETLLVHPSFSERGVQNAPVTIIEFSDFQCPFCNRVSKTLDDVLQAYPDKVRLIFKHAPLPIHPQSNLIHEAVSAAGAQGKFWQMHDLVFANPQKAEKADLVQLATQLRLDVRRFEQALENQLFKPIVDRDLSEAKGLGVTGTPTFFINGRKLVGAKSFEAFKAVIDEALGINPRMLSSRPAEIDVKNAPSQGSPKAPINIVVFSDFQCPFCSTVGPTLHQLLAQNPGKVKVHFKHFPLDFHKDAPLAHEAALAAGAQGRFWEMHDWIFSNQKMIKRDDLVQAARGLGLDMDRFAADLDSGRFKPAVETDKQEGVRLGVDGTPALFMNGKRLDLGARSLADLTAAVLAELQSGLAAASVKAADLEEKADPLITKGPSDAPITIVWFADLLSALTPKSNQLLDQILASYPSKVRVVFKHRPVLELHPDAALVHEAALAAAQQGKFWEMQQLIAANSSAQTKDDYAGYAQQLGLALPPFVAALEGRIYRSKVEKDLEEARRREVRGSPVFFVNQKRVGGLQSLAYFRELIDAELKQISVSQK